MCPAGVHIDLPVLSPKDVEDVQLFAVKNDMDFIAASFVQVGGVQRVQGVCVPEVNIRCRLAAFGVYVEGGSMFRGEVRGGRGE